MTMKETIFPICYSTARSLLIRGSGANLNVHVSPHDLRRYSAIYSPIYDEAHQIIGVTVYVIDVTERKRAVAARLM